MKLLPLDDNQLFMFEMFLKYHKNDLTETVEKMSLEKRKKYEEVKARWKVTSVLYRGSMGQEPK